MRLPADFVSAMRGDIPPIMPVFVPVPAPAPRPKQEPLIKQPSKLLCRKKVAEPAPHLVAWVDEQILREKLKEDGVYLTGKAFAEVVERETTGSAYYRELWEGTAKEG